jgi:hypothetical protein
MFDDTISGSTILAAKKTPKCLVKLGTNIGIATRNSIVLMLALSSPFDTFPGGNHTT